MEANDNVELIQIAIQRLIEEKKNKGIISSGSSLITDEDEDEDDDQILLSRLLSQLESLKGDGVLHKHELPSEEMEVNHPDIGEMKKMSEAVEGGDSNIELKKDDIVKELRKLKKQNLITHCLLSFMIVLTLAWQLSEVSLILKVKNGLTNPLRSFGDMLNGMFKGPVMIGQDGNKVSVSAKQPKIEAPSIPPIKIPELPHMDLSCLGLDGDED